MPDPEMGPDQLVPKGLPSARRGYDRHAVDQLLDEARRSWAALHLEHRRLLAEIDRAGGLDYLARDLGAVGTDVGRLLADAQGASQSLRERARADAAERVAAAVVEARRLIAEAETQAFHLRADAWAAAEALTLQAEAAHRAMVAEADAEVLVIRAEAEQEAYRLVSSARREAQDITRGARFEAERAVLEIRSQPERILPVEPEPVAAPAPAPEPAAGKARRRRAAAEAAPPSEEIVRVIQPPGVRRAGGDIDPGFYGDALAAEVEALRVSGEVEVVRVEPVLPKDEELPVPAPEVSAVPPAEESPALSAAEPPVEGPSPEAPTVAEVEWAESAPAEAAPEEAEEAPAAGDAAGAGEAGAPTGPIPPPAGPIDHLFARLRGGRVPEAAAPAEAAPAPRPGKAAPPPTRPDPLELRERLLLPVQNRALRRVKEAIVELQNVALDGLRVAGSWEGTTAAASALEAALDPVAEEGAIAGANAAGAFLGREPAAPVIGARCRSLVGAMAGDLAAQVEAAVAGTAGAGPLEVAAAAARVFRAWRSDEAERWVRTVAYAAYHDSLLAGLAVSGVGAVAAVGAGLLCPECPAARGTSWDPAGNPPPGTLRPPAHLGCVCTVAPPAAS